MNISKICFKCNIDKHLTEFYKHKKMGDGYLGKCKDCTKFDTKVNLDLKLQDKDFHEKEKERHRAKYHRLEYREKHKPTKEAKKQIMGRYKEKYPEKAKARSYAQKLAIKGLESHHWSYNDEHLKDVIHLTVADHNLLHRHMEYDQEFKMYRRNGILLDTKESHLKLLEENKMIHLFE